MVLLQNYYMAACIYQGDHSLRTPQCSGTSSQFDPIDDKTHLNYLCPFTALSIHCKGAVHCLCIHPDSTLNLHRWLGTYRLGSVVPNSKPLSCVLSLDNCPHIYISYLPLPVVRLCECYEP